MTKKIDAPVEIPESHNTPEFVTAWNKWLRWRKEEKGVKATPTAQRMALAKLAKVSVCEAIACILTGIERDWRGLDPEWCRSRKSLVVGDTHARYGTVRRCLNCDKGPIDKLETKCPECRAEEAAILERRGAAIKREASQ